MIKKERIQKQNILSMILYLSLYCKKILLHQFLQKTVDKDLQMKDVSKKCFLNNSLTVKLKHFHFYISINLIILFTLNQIQIDKENKTPILQQTTKQQNIKIKTSVLINQKEKTFLVLFCEKMIKKQNSSITTIFTLLNSMIGGAMLTFPVLFSKAGIVTGILVLVVSCTISYLTCRIYVMHLAPKDNDVEDTIKRIMGIKWERFFRLITGFYLVLLNIIYIILIVDQIYNIIYFIMSKSGAEQHIAPKDVDHFVFDKFSKQWLSLIMFIPLLAITFMKNLSFVIKLASYGVGSVFIYFIFLIYQFIKSLANGVDFSKITWVSSSIGQLAGTSAVAFTIHTVVATIIKSNKNQQNNMRDLKISYLLGLVLYSAIGSMGYIAIWNLSCTETIVNCYLTDIASVFVEVSYLYGLTTVYPCFIEVGRSRLLLYFFPEIKKNHLRNFNIAFMSAAIMFCFLGPYINLNTVLNLVGSLVCFFFIYFIPSNLHLQCFYKKKSQEGQDRSLMTSQTTEESADESKCSHSQDQKDKRPEKLRRFLYIFLNVIGVGIGVYGIYLIFA